MNRTDNGKIIYIVGIVGIFLVVGLLTFLYMKNRNDNTNTTNADSEKVSAEEGTTEDMWLKNLEENNTLELSRMSHENRQTVTGTDYEAFDNKLCAWWFKRNDNHEKSGCQEDFDIVQYDAYYTVPVSEKRMFITFEISPLELPLN